MYQMMAWARSGFEHFHILADGSSTQRQVETSSAGLIGWAKYGVTTLYEYQEQHLHLPHRVPPGNPRRAVKLQLSDLLGEKHEKHVDLMTRATTQGAMTISSTARDGWEVIEITIDSGACDTVFPSSMLSMIKTESTEASRNGEEYEVANGNFIVNEGQKRCLMMTPGSATPKGVVFQVSDVHKPLMSVGAMADAGYEVLFKKEGGYMCDMDTGELIPLTRKGNLYTLKAWVCAADASFTRQS